MAVAKFLVMLKKKSGGGANRMDMLLNEGDSVAQEESIVEEEIEIKFPAKKKDKSKFQKKSVFRNSNLNQQVLSFLENDNPEPIIEMDEDSDENDFDVP